MTNPHNDRTAIVCGGSAGIGLATVKKLLARGYRVGVVARGKERLAELEARFGTDRICGVSADVSEAGELRSAMDEIVGRFGAPDVWINCAMLTSFSPFEQVEEDEFKRIMDVTFLGQVNGTRLALGHASCKRIVNVGSGLGYRSVPYQSAYCAAKHAINGFTSSVRTELLHDGRDTTISLVQLPAVNTPQFDWARNRMEHRPQPAPPIYNPHVAATAILQAVDTGQREILVGKSVLQLVLGQLALPDLLDHRLADAGVAAQQTEIEALDQASDNLWDPEDRPATSQGYFGDRARDDALIVDGDRARHLALAAGAVPFMIGGFLAGVLLGRNR